MNLPQRPTNLTPATAPIVDSVLVELHEIRHVHELAEAGEDHRGNRLDAARAHAEVNALLQRPPHELSEFALRAGYVAGVMMAEISGEAVA